MKGVPLRIEVGPRDLAESKLMIYRRDTEKKVSISEKDLLVEVAKEGKDLSENLKKKSMSSFEGLIKDVKNVEEIKKIVGTGIARANFCSVEKDAEKCAETVEKETGGKIRGTRIDINDKLISGEKCVVCGKKATKVVYIAKDY
jgi:prolyl-tRNA synthetase